MSASVPAQRSSPVLLVIVLVALAIGAAASLVAGAATAPAFHSGPDSEVIIPIWGLEAAFVLAFGTVIGLLLWIRLGSSTAAISGKLVVTALVTLLVGVLFVVLLQVLGGGGGGFISPNTSGNSTMSGGGTPPANSTGSLGGPGGVLAPLHVPEWTLFVVVAVVALVVAAVAVPRAWGLWSRRDRDGPSRKPRPAEIAEVRAALASAAQSLGGGAEPRDVIITLYATVLARVGPIVGGVEVDTPEEIRILHLVRLGIRPSAAETLTRLFEEARYSTHPMGADAADRARGAIDDARADLDRRAPLP